MKNIFMKFYFSLQFNLFYLFIINTTLVGCFTVKPTITGSSKKLFETFYVGEFGIQYYIKPLFFENKKTKEILLIDFTFRYKDKIKDSAIVNFSIISSNLYKSLDSLKITSTILYIKSSKITLLFNKKSKKQFISRFTSNISLAELKKLFDSEECIFFVYSPTQTIGFKPSSKTMISIVTLRKNLFILM